MKNKKFQPCNYTLAVPIYISLLPLPSPLVVTSYHCVYCYFCH